MAVDPSSSEVLASELTSNEEGDASRVGSLLDQISGALVSVTADGVYDGEPVYRNVAERKPASSVAVVIPPRSTSVPSPETNTRPSHRDQHIDMTQAKGRQGWQKAVGYGRRSHAKTAMFRYKAIIGSSLRTRTLPAQVPNRMTRLGIPVSQAPALRKP